MKKSIIFTENIEVIQKYLDGSSSMAEICRKLGLSGNGRSSTILNRRIRDSDEFDLEKYEKNKSIALFNTRKGKSRKNLDDVLIENSLYTNTSRLKSHMLRLNLICNKCDKCGLSPEWEGEPLVLVLDHINGVNNDHRLENLRLLCPNCNSQQETFCRGKYVINKKNRCIDCEKEISRSSTYCRSCAGKKFSKHKVEHPTKEELIKDILEMPIKKVGDKYGVSDNSIRNWAEKYNINYKMLRNKSKLKNCI